MSIQRRVIQCQAAWQQAACQQAWMTDFVIKE